MSGQNRNGEKPKIQFPFHDASQLTPHLRRYLAAGRAIRETILSFLAAILILAILLPTALQSSTKSPGLPNTLRTPPPRTFNLPGISARCAIKPQRLQNRPISRWQLSSLLSDSIHGIPPSTFYAQ
jgi:hypothetical protein